MKQNRKIAFRKDYFFYIIIIGIILLAFVVFFVQYKNTLKITGRQSYTGGDSFSGSSEGQPTPLEIGVSYQAVSLTSIFAENSQNIILGAKTINDLGLALSQVSTFLASSKIELSKSEELFSQYPLNDIIKNNHLQVKRNVENLERSLENVNNLLGKDAQQATQQITNTNTVQTKWVVKVNGEIVSSNEQLKSELDKINEDLGVSLEKILESPGLDNVECQYPILESVINNKNNYGASGVAYVVSISSDGKFIIPEYCNKVSEVYATSGDVGSANEKIITFKDVYENSVASVSYSIVEYKKPTVKITIGRDPQEPAFSPDNCFNAVWDNGEERTDCGGFCEKACEPSPLLKPSFYEFPFIYWGLFLFFLMLLYFVNFNSSLVVSTYIDIGKRAVRMKDFRRAIESYEKTQKYFASLNDSYKAKYRQKCLDYYLLLKNELKSIKVNIKQPFVEKESLPDLIYDDSKIGLKKISNSDFERVKRLIENYLIDDEDGKINNSEELKKIIMDIYNGLEEKEKRTIRVLYRDFFRQF